MFKCSWIMLAVVLLEGFRLNNSQHWFGPLSHPGESFRHPYNFVSHDWAAPKEWRPSQIYAPEVPPSGWPHWLSRWGHVHQAGPADVTRRSDEDPSITSTRSKEYTPNERLDNQGFIPDSNQSLRLYGGKVPHDGFLETKISGMWVSVCGRQWNSKMTTLACRQMGYVRGGVYSHQKHLGLTPSFSVELECPGDADSLSQCGVRRVPCAGSRRVRLSCLRDHVSGCNHREYPFMGKCHLVVATTPMSHDRAQGFCAWKSSTLMVVHSQAMNDFLSELLSTLHKGLDGWHTDGVGVDSIWRWEAAGVPWGPYLKWHPAVRLRDLRECLVLRRRFHSGSPSGLPLDHRYLWWTNVHCDLELPFVCQRDADNIGCLRSDIPYSGLANVTENGNPCLLWSDAKIAPMVMANSPQDYPELKDHNFCRTPDGDSRPWCYVAVDDYEYCDIPRCAAHTEQRNSLLSNTCLDNEFRCSPDQCIRKEWVCDDDPDCQNERDELNCHLQLEHFEKMPMTRLSRYEAARYFSVSLTKCAAKCVNTAAFVCHSFSYTSSGGLCILSEHNVALTGALVPDPRFDYYENLDRQLNCTQLFRCRNGKCVDRRHLCDVANDCGDRSDEVNCLVRMDFQVRLGGGALASEGRVQVQVHGQWGLVCDDHWDIHAANVVCRELGFPLGALEPTHGSQHGTPADGESLPIFMDDVQCVGNETSLSQCGFPGWKKHNCFSNQTAGVRCKTKDCGDRGFECLGRCVPFCLLCNDHPDCADGSDERIDCDAQLEVRLVGGPHPHSGRLEVRRFGLWGTVCDHGFGHAEATVACLMMGIEGGNATVLSSRPEAGRGPIWLEYLSCRGTERSLEECRTQLWGETNCSHSEDVVMMCVPINSVAPATTITALSPICGDPKYQPQMDQVYMNNNHHRFNRHTWQEPPYARDWAPGPRPRRGLISGRIVDGVPAHYGAHPWLVDIRLRSASGHTMHWCAGAILSHNLVLSAAHCFKHSPNASELVVRIGEHRMLARDVYEVDFEVEEFRVHQGFEADTFFNDISLLKIRPIRNHGILFNDHVMPVCLPAKEDVYAPGTSCVIAGWGKTIINVHQLQSSVLQTAAVPLYEPGQCEKPWVYGYRIKRGMFCAGHVDGGMDACHGDSGGPLVCRSVTGKFAVFGIISWGEECGLPNRPGVYVKVQDYTDWIAKTEVELQSQH